MSEERYKYHCDDYDYIEIIYDTKECEECDSMRMATNLLNRQDQRIADLEAKLAKRDEFLKIAYEDIDELQKENDKLEQQLVSNSKWLKLLDKQSVQIKNHNQDKIELLEKVVELVTEKSMTQSPFGTQKIFASDVEEIIDTLISEIRGDEVV